MNFAGAVLAGGKSSRMGRNKALLRLDGEPLWRRQLRVLEEAGADPVWLVQALGQRALTRGVLRDTACDAGPLAGLHAALLAVASPSAPDILRDKTPNRSTHLAVLAVDLPRLGPAWFTRLAKLCAPGIGAVTRTPDGYEPLAAIYPSDALPFASTQLTSGDFALQQFVATLVRRKRLRVLRLKPSERKQLANWNTPADIGQALAGSRTRSFWKPKAKVGAPVRN